jgi:hypothetical protein
MRSDRTPEPDPQSDEKRANIHPVYPTAQERAERGEALVRTDERTGGHAREPKPPDLPMPSGRVVYREFESIRQGTRSLIVNFQLVDGTVGPVSAGPTRNEADFRAPIQPTIEANPPLVPGPFSVDHLNPHPSASPVR